MKKIFFILTMLLVPFMYASAHVKWFVDSSAVVDSEHASTAFYYLTSKEVLIWSLITVLVVGMFALIDRHTKSPERINTYAARHKGTIEKVAQALLGVFLITVTLLWKIVLIPEFPIDSHFMLLLGSLQIIAGTLYLFDIYPRIGSLLLFGLIVIMTFFVGWVALLENIILITLALFFYVRHSSKESVVFRLNDHVLEIVRIGVGVSLIVLAFTEKLMYPELSLTFLDVHKWNFMQNFFGIEWFSNELFVLSTGFAEMIFGILFIFGYITRITTVLIACFFAMSVVTMLVQFNKWEVEDLVVYSAAVLLIMFGSGVTRFFHRISTKSYMKKSVGDLLCKKVS